MRRIQPLILLTALFLASPAWAQAPSSPPEKSKQAPHGPSNEGFLSHNFQWAPHEYESQLNVHFGLSQPLLLNGFNIAMDYRIGQWVFEYSHGMFLDYNASEGIGERFVGKSGADLDSPWTTGGGVGYILLDDLYLMLEVKVHRYEMELSGEKLNYTTASVGPALAYRLFLWRGLNLTAYVRWWPNVWDSTEGKVELANTSFEPVDLGLFANLSLGWAFDL